MLGDAGEPQFPKDNNLKTLKNHLDKASQDDILIFLGDNIYNNGLRSINQITRSDDESKLLKLLQVTDDFPGNTFVLPGNHDWDNSGKDGFVNVINQQKLVNKYLESSMAFLPGGARPGPKLKRLSGSLILIAYDLQWFLHSLDKPDQQINSRKTFRMFFNHLKKMLASHQDKQIILASHHPFVTYGDHSKSATIKDLIFPLRFRDNRLMLPLPGIGYLFPFLHFNMPTQDLCHPTYHYIKRKILKLLDRYDNIYHVSGHDHSFQHSIRKGNHYIVSGSGSKISSIYPGKYLIDYRLKTGFAKLIFKKYGEVILEFWEPFHSDKMGQLLYKNVLKKYNSNFVLGTEAQVKVNQIA